MKIKDRIYGNFDIKEPVLIELIKSRPVQRLKGIAQFGVPDKYFNVKGFSRYEHSIGVMILLRLLNVDLKEQIAGLLHDASHYSFSHVADWVFGTQEHEDYHDKIMKRYFKDSGIKQILKKYNINYKDILRLKNFKVLKREIPYLCADRLDYSLREFTIKNTKYFLKNLQVKNNKIVFINRAPAITFGKAFLNLQLNRWGSLEAIARYGIMSEILKDAIKKRIISESDFLIDDKYIIDKISKDNGLLNELDKLKTKKLNMNILNQYKSARKKFRYVDPEFIKNGKIVHLSNEDTSFKKLIDISRSKQKQSPAGDVGKEGKTYITRQDSV